MESTFLYRAICATLLHLIVLIPTCRAQAYGTLRLRTTSGTGTSYGRLEVYYNGVWGTVCDDSFSSVDAGVACRQLGYSYGYAYCCAIYGQGSGTIWLDNVACSGSEATLSSCTHSTWGSNNCGHSEDVGIRCYNSLGTSEGSVRLVTSSGSIGTSSGRLEVYHSGIWGTVCDDSFSTTDANVACRQLGYTYGYAYCCGLLGRGTGTIWLDDVACSGGESRLTSCAAKSWGSHNCGHSEDVGVSCHHNNNIAEGSVRLVSSLLGTTGGSYGRVEIYHNSVWGTVCDDSFGSSDATVVCRQLGYDRGDAYCCARYGYGAGTIWMDGVSCSGSEFRLSSCVFQGWGINNCGHSEDVSVQCYHGSGVTTNSPQNCNMFGRCGGSSTGASIGLLAVMTIVCLRYGRT